MRFADILGSCARNLFRRKSRTILTVLGVIVGCCSIVLMVSFAQGINESNEKTLKSMGDLSIVTVYTAGGMEIEGGGSRASGAEADGQQAKLDDKALEAFRALPGVAGVTPVVTLPYNTTAKAGAGGRYIYDGVSVMGIDMSQFDTMGFKLKDGDKPLRDGQVLAGEWLPYGFIDSLDNGAQRTYAESGSCSFNEATGECETPESEDPFFNPLTTPIELISGVDYSGDPYVQSLYGGYGGASGGAASGTGSTGASADPKNAVIDLKVTGVVASDYNKGYATVQGFVMDLKAMKALIAQIDASSASSAKSTAYDQVFVKASDLSKVPEVESQLKSMGYQTSSYEDIRKQMEEQTRVIQLILGGIGAVSLLVAAIGIANTMVMSVSERTREIGIMKALGCAVRDIRMMFLTEAGAIGFLGGAVGAALSALVSLGINMGGMWLFGPSGGLAMGGSSGGSGSDDGAGMSFWTMFRDAVVGGDDVTRYSVIPWWLYLFAVLFATCLGLLFGFGPANRAVKIPALDAIRNDR